VEILEQLPTLAPENYVWLSRVQGSLWTLADIIICWYLLKTANHLRNWCQLPPHRLGYVALLATLPFAILIPIAPNAQAFYRLELVVTVPHFLIIVQVLYSNYRHRYRYFAALAASSRKHEFSSQNS
jgi:hypothetical protein